MGEEHETRPLLEILLAARELTYYVQNSIYSIFGQ
jgi:hypothetical protein